MKNNGRWVIVLTIALVAVAGWATYIRQENRRAQDSAQGFISAITSLEQSSAVVYLVDEAEQHSVAFRSLKVLAQGTVPKLESKGKVKWRIWPRVALVDLHLRTDSRTEQLTLGLRKVGRSYMVETLPNLIAHPAVLVERLEEAQVAVRAYSSQTVVSTTPGLKPGTVGYGIVLDKRLVHFAPAQEVEVGRVMRYIPKGIFEGEYMGGELSRDVAFISLEPEREPRLLNKLIPGSPGASVVMWQGRIFGVILREPLELDTVRVALNTTGYQGLVHERVVLSSAEGLRIEDHRSGRSVDVPPGTSIALLRVQEGLAVSIPGQQVFFAESRVYVTSRRSTGRVTIAGLARALGTPSYRGIIEVSTTNEQTGLFIVNEVGLDEYLYSVVPSEMPVTFGLEALKAQALAARGYAVVGVLSGGYVRTGAHMEDGVMSQVYGNVVENELATLAVDSTSGLVPTVDGGIIDARFYSTSSGFTANHSEVWSSGSEFPGADIPYLKSQPQTTEVITLPDEEAVRAFLKRTDLDAPDKDAPYFRWSVTFSRAELEAVLVNNLPERLAAQPTFVTKLDGGASLGTLTDIRVVRRGAGGNIMQLELVGSDARYSITKEYNVRTILRPTQYLRANPAIRLRLGTGATVYNLGILPSAFAALDIARDLHGNIMQVTIFGGGNGHGVGLSQTGARGLAQRGYGYKDILQHYYPGVEITELEGLQR